MKNVQTVTGKFEVVKRLPSSANGNPRYQVRIGDVVCKTAVDSSLGYSATNYDGKLVVASYGLHYGTLTLDDVQAVANSQAA